MTILASKRPPQPHAEAGKVGVRAARPASETDSVADRATGLTPAIHFLHGFEHGRFGEIRPRASQVNHLALLSTRKGLASKTVASKCFPSNVRADSISTAAGNTTESRNSPRAG